MRELGYVHGAEWRRHEWREHFGDRHHDRDDRKWHHDYRD